jgi:hypothetical protein
MPFECWLLSMESYPNSNDCGATLLFYTMIKYTHIQVLWERIHMLRLIARGTRAIH